MRNWVSRSILAVLLLSAFMFSTAFAQQYVWPLKFSVTPNVWAKNSTFDVLACWWYEGPGNSIDIVDEEYFNIAIDSSLGTVNGHGTLVINEAADYAGQIVVSDPVQASDFTVGNSSHRLNTEYNGSTKQLRYASSVCTPLTVTTPNAEVHNFARFVANVSGMSGKPQVFQITVQ